MSENDELGPWSTVEQLVRTLRLPAVEADDLVSRIVGEACLLYTSPSPRDRS